VFKGTRGGRCDEIPQLCWTDSVTQNMNNIWGKKFEICSHEFRMFTKAIREIRGSEWPVVSIIMKFIITTLAHNT
jgi:hypothetical protein